MFKRVRECDGACCKESPRWPTVDGKSCIYLNPDNRCQIQTGEKSIPHKRSPAQPSFTAKEAFRLTCAEWPENRPGKRTGNCCKQWVDDGN